VTRFTADGSEDAYPAFHLSAVWSYGVKPYVHVD
jgi:hypothetical protein